MKSPPLFVRVTGLSFQYQFTEDDVRKVFSRYGEVEQVVIGEGDDASSAGAKVIFKGFANAMAAWSDLNGKALAGITGATLKVECPQLTGAVSSTASATNSDTNSTAEMRQQQFASSNSMSSFGPASSGAGKNALAARKYTCRLLIGIENEKEYRVGSKVIQLARKIWQELPSFQQNGGKT
jgi:RNA recognition motif-containing protein